MQAPYNTVYFSLVGDQTALLFFDVKQNTGEIIVKKDLITDLNTQYMVSAYTISLFELTVHDRNCCVF